MKSLNNAFLNLHMSHYMIYLFNEMRWNVYIERTIFMDD